MLDTYPRTFQSTPDLLAAAIDAVDDCAQACNADNAADLSAHMRAAASRAGVPVRQACQDVA